MKRLLGLIAVFCVVGCGGGRNPDREVKDPSLRLGDYTFEKTSDTHALTYANGQLDGTGDIRMTDLLPAAKVAANYSFTFQVKEGGSLTLVTNARRDLSAGVEFKLSRTNGSQKLAGQVVTASSRQDVGEALAGLNADEQVTLSVDVHNDHFQPEVIVWTDSSKEKDEEPAVETSLPGTGQGVNWGFRLEQATLIHVQRLEPRETH